MSARNQALIDAMTAKSMSSGQLARAVGVVRTTASNWRDGRIPGWANATRAAQLLDTSVEQLWPDLTPPDLNAEALADRRARLDRVAEAAGVTRDTVRGWLNGRRRPGVLARAALAANGFAIEVENFVHRGPSQRNASTHGRPFTCHQVLTMPAGPPDPKWKERALCASHPDPDLWWPEDENDPGIKAREICARCPVITDCRDHFLDAPWSDRRCVVAGVWGQSLIEERAWQRRQKEAA